MPGILKIGKANELVPLSPENLRHFILSYQNVWESFKNLFPLDRTFKLFPSRCLIVLTLAQEKSLEACKRFIVIMIRICVNIKKHMMVQ